MVWIIWFFIPVIIYFLVGWACTSIYMSFLNPTEIAQMTIFEYEMIRVWVYDIVAAIYIVIIGLLADDDDEKYNIYGLVVLVTAFIVTNILPPSLGAAIINALICIGAMVIYTYSQFID